MELEITYFGMLVDITKCQSEKINIQQEEIETIEALLTFLFKKHKGLEDKKFQVAQNNKIAKLNDAIITSEIALLPPFSGG